MTTIRRGAAQAAFLFFCTVLLLPAATPAPLAVKPGELSGVVCTLAGQPAPQITVTVRQGEQVVVSATSDAQGRYRLPGLQPGAYTLSVAPTLTLALVVHEAATIASLRIVLPPAATAPTAPATPVAGTPAPAAPAAAPVAYVAAVPGLPCLPCACGPCAWGSATCDSVLAMGGAITLAAGAIWIFGEHLDVFGDRKSR